MEISAFCVLFNVFLANVLPLLEAIILIFYVSLFAAIVVILWVLAPVLGEPLVVFTNFANLGGWSNLGGAAIVGISAGIKLLLGADAAVHMVCIPCLPPCSHDALLLQLLPQRAIPSS